MLAHIHTGFFNTAVDNHCRRTGEHKRDDTANANCEDLQGKGKKGQTCEQCTDISKNSVMYEIQRVGILAAGRKKTGEPRRAEGHCPEQTVVSKKWKGQG